MDNQLNHSCWLLVSKAEPLWLLPCAVTFKSARFLAEINDLPVFCHRISLLGVYAAAQFVSRCTFRSTLQNLLFEARQQRYAGGEECTHA